MKTRFIREIGTRASLRRYWGDDCPNCKGGGRAGYHNAEKPLAQSPRNDDFRAFGKPEDYPAERWPQKCDHCGAACPEDAQRQIFTERLYDSPSGNPEPGDLFFVDRGCKESSCYAGWTNCEGVHLHCVLPNGTHWDIDSRCDNCTRRGDTTHRCWVRVGAPPNVTAGKSGDTCSAGAGSIAVPGWHGFLKAGELEEC